ncbi:MAG: ZmpA/ZmpB/ZmpC family metallo-endopeptidase-related protein [Polyangia bacterium]
MSIGILNIAACGAVPDGAEQTETRTGALGSTAPQKTINNLTDLKNMDAYGNYLLTANLNASGFTWHYGYFYGTLDGGNHTISNLTTSDSIGQAAGLFVYAEGALIKNLKLTNVHVSGTYDVGGLVGDCVNCGIENVAVEGTMTAPMYAGGIVGGLNGGYITKSYFKGTVNGGTMGTGGLVGLAAVGDSFATISNSYAQAASTTLATAGTGSGNRPAGGIVGYGTGFFINDVYAVGDVTGRGNVGGLVGQPACNGSDQWILYNAIYRGNVTDANISPTGGWAGTVGTGTDMNCNSRFAGLFYNTDLDGSTHHFVYGSNQLGVTTLQMKQPTTANGGVFCLPDVIPSRCGDNGFASPPWDAGTSSQYHALMNMPGPNAQPR